MNYNRILFVCCILGCNISNAFSQTISVGEQGFDDLMRTYQLTGKINKDISFAVRPLFFADEKKSRGNLTRDSFYTWLYTDSVKPSAFKIGKNRGELVILPAQWSVKFNTHHPYGWNDEGMLQAKGFQQQLSAGVFAKYGALSIQLQPQFVTAGDPNFESNINYGGPGGGSFSKLFPGQSSVRLNVGPFSLGLSTENLWWGPGQYSALVLSNNAPGFAHITLNTTRPVETPVGSFEFQLVGGKLDEDSASGQLYENFNLTPNTLKNDWRYFNGFVLSYQPAFLKGVFVGFSRGFQMYHDDINKIKGSFLQKYLPIATAFFKKNTQDEDAKARDQVISTFMRVLFPKSHTEFYFEYGWNDHKANSRDFFTGPDHSSAYLVGGKKLVALNKEAWLELSAEITQMAQASEYIVRNAGNWYIHGQVQQGMTHQKQILGAGSGLGNNVQTFTTARIHGAKRLGIILQRIQHDPRALVGTISTAGIRTYQWVETAIGIQHRWQYKHLMIYSELQYSGSKNYAWEEGKSRSNLYGVFKIAYTW
jgi:hypothetical protein